MDEPFRGGMGDTYEKARNMLMLSMAVFGTIGLFVRNIPLVSGEIALYRAVLPLLLVSGVAMGINWILLFEAYKYTTVAAATLSYYFAPVIGVGGIGQGGLLILGFTFWNELAPGQSGEEREVREERDVREMRGEKKEREKEKRVDRNGKTE